MSEFTREQREVLERLLLWAERLAYGEATEARRRRTGEACDAVRRAFGLEEEGR